MTTKLYCDTRKSRNGVAPINISISSMGQTVYVPTGIKVLSEQWDAKAQKIVYHPMKAKLNNLLSQKKYDIDSALFRLQDNGLLHGLNASEIKTKVLLETNPDLKRHRSLILPRIEAYSARQTKTATNYTYKHTADKIRAYTPDADLLRFEDITPRWLGRFNEWMSTDAPSQNARNIILRNIRTVFNEAIDDGITDFYPFRKFKIRAVATKSRALTVEQLRKIFADDSEYADVFKLSFYLGGISMCDLCALTKDNIVSGRIEYRRQKTEQFVSVGIQKEAQELLDKLAGDKHLIFVSDRTDYRAYLKGMNNYLKHLGTVYDPTTKKWIGEPICSSVSQYWSRYSVATIAAELGIGQDVIAAILGHSTSGVTSIYMRANRNRQVDTALRTVFNFIRLDSL